MPDYRPNKFGYASGVPSLSEVFDSFDKMSEAANQRQLQAQLQDVRGQQELAQIARSKELEQANQMALAQEQDRIAAERQKANIAEYLRLRDTIGKKGGRVSVNFGQGGAAGFTEAEPNPWGIFNIGLAKEKEATKLSDRIIKSKLPEADAALKDAQNTTDITSSGLYKVAGALPIVGGEKLKSGIATVQSAWPELLGGSSKPMEELSAYASLRNMLGHEQYGSAFTETERRMLSEQLGANDANVRKAAIERIRRKFAEKGVEIQAGFSPEIQGIFKQNVPGAKLPTEMFQPAGGQRTIVRVQKNKKTGQTKTTYSDGSEEIK